MRLHYQFPSYWLCFVFFVTIALVSAGWQQSQAYSVSELTATYSNGQVFLVWKNPAKTNLQYNVYRSSTKFTANSQLTSSKLLGFVRDNSGKNIERSNQGGTNIYFKITDNGQSLASDKGLFVVTCTTNGSWYYAVTVTDLTTNKEVKEMILGKNSLDNPVLEQLTKPLPVFQDSVVIPGGDIKYNYVLYGNSQETSLLPALNSTGSFSFNFYIGKRGTATLYPLYVLYGAGGPNNLGLETSITNCYVLGVDDWLPLPPGSGSDDAEYCCYHEKFNIYSKNNPVPTSGVVKTYPQRRYIEAIHWAKSHFPIDAGRVYGKGGSQRGNAALLTAAIIPDEITCVYATCEPMSLVTGGLKILEQMWGTNSSNLYTDVLDWRNQQPLRFYTLTDMRDMVEVNEQRNNVPLIYDVHGKNDVTVLWSPAKIEWLDSLESNHVGGIFYWDQRIHGGTGQNFLDEETMPDFTRYSIAKSYPAFSNCSINQNPGNGTPINGDPYGAINGYLDWDDNITDENCDYSINVMVVNLYVGGILDLQQYNTCTTDVTFRRLQNFHPSNGATVKWKNFDDNNNQIQNGSLVYNGGIITIKNIIVNKSGNRIDLHINNCQREGVAIEEPYEPNIYFTQTGQGYLAHVDADHNEEIQLLLYDISGRIVQSKKEMLISGSNVMTISSPGSGIFLVVLKGDSFTKVTKLLFY